MSQIGGLPALVGNWQFVNETDDRPPITGTFLFNNNGYMLMKIPNRNGLGDYTQEESWGYLGLRIATFCNTEGNCQNSTLTTITPNHVEFIDSNNNTVHLMRFHPSSIATDIAAAHRPPPETNNVTVLYQNGENQADAQNYTGAKAIYQKALEINPHDVKVLADIGRVLNYLKNYTGALQSLDKAITLESRDAYALGQKGFVLYNLGDYKQALVNLERAVELDPRDTQTMNTEGATLMQLGDYAGANSVFDAVIRADQFENKAYYNKALALEDRGLQTHNIEDIKMALQTVNKTLSIYADNKEAQNLKLSLTDLLTWSNGQGQ